MRARKVFLVNLWPILISLTLRLDPRIMSFWKSSFNFIIPTWTCQHHILDILASYPFSEIEVELESDPEPQIGSDIFTRFFLYSEVNIEFYTSIPWNGITNLLWSYFIHGEVYDYQFFDLDPIFESISTLFVDSRLDPSQLPESVSIFTPVPFESKSIIFQNHTSFLDKNVDKNDSVIIFEIWKLDGNKFLNKTIQAIILLLGHIREVISGFLEDPRYLDWVATLGLVRPPLEPPSWGNLPSFSICFMSIHIHDALRTMHEISVGEDLLT